MSEEVVQPKTEPAKSINWKSRKFLLALASIIMMCVVAYQGNLPWKEAMGHVSWIAMAYMVGEGVADHGGGRQITDLLKLFLGQDGGHKPPKK